MVEKRQQTTVTIDTNTGARLERLAKANGVSKKEFISLSLDCFEKYGINPAKHESPAQEMQKLIRRIDQVVAFQKVQERDFIRPAMQSVMKTEERINYEMNRLSQSYDNIHKMLSAMLDLDERTENEQKRANEELKKALMLLAKYMDEKNKSGLMGKIFG